MTCPSCEYNKQRAAIWRAEAYKQAGHDVIQRPWVGLTDEEIGSEYVRFGIQGGFNRFEYAVKALEAKLKEKNT